MERMEKQEFSEGTDSSEASFDLTPYKVEFQQLADTLKETDKNLHTFEFMFNQYKKLAKVTPVQNQESSNNKLIEDELQKIASSIKTLENQTSALPELKSQLSQRSEEKDATGQIDFLKGTIEELKLQLQDRDAKCSALIESNQRLSSELSAEKERNSMLDRKLYEEKKAAQVVSKDVQKYAEYAKGLEVKVEELKQKAKASKQEEIRLVEQAKTVDDPILCQTCVSDDNNDHNQDSSQLQNIADKVEKIAVSIQHRNEEIVQEIKRSGKIQSAVPPPPSSSSLSRDVPDESQSHHRSSRKTGEKKALLKMELAEVEAERDSLLLINEQLQKEVNKLINDAYVRENKHLSLKAKCKTLLSKHKRQSDERKSLIRKLKLAKRVLLDVEHLVKLHEQNHGVLMNYFGGQAEVLGKLLSTFVGSKYEAPSLVVEAHPKLTQWFCNVHSVLEWSEKQLIAVGEKLWYEGYSGDAAKLKDEVIEVDMSTLSEISQNLDKDDHFPSDVLRVLENQDSILQNTRQSVKELKTVLHKDELL